MKRFDCGSIMPGCEKVFTGSSDQNVLDQVLAHTAEEHGLPAPPLPYLELVMTHTHPFALAHLVGGAAAKPQYRSKSPVSTGRQVSTRSQPGSNVRLLRQLKPDSERPAKAHQTYRHECLLYSGEEGFLDAVVPFVRDGVERRQPVIIAVAEPRLTALRSALGADADQVMFADMADLGRNPASIIPALREFTDQHSGIGRPVRGVGEPVWAGRQPAEIVEAQLHEALLNVAVPPDLPLWLLCTYDTSALDEQMLTEAHRSHPVVVELDVYQGSTRYGGAAHVEDIFGSPLPEPEVRPRSIVFDPSGHGHVRAVLDFACDAGLPVDRAVRLATAVDEIGRATHRETGYVRLRLWSEQGALICEVTDPGRVRDPMIGRGDSHGLPPRDRALWLGNELSDLVQVRSGVSGTTTRVLSWVSGPAAGSSAPELIRQV